MEKVLFLFAGILGHLNNSRVSTRHIYYDETTEIARTVFEVGSQRHNIVLFAGPTIRLMMDDAPIATISPKRGNAYRARSHCIRAVKASLS